MSDPAHAAPAGDQTGDPVTLDGSSLTLEDLARAARDPRVRIDIHPSAAARVQASRDQIEGVVRKYKEAFESGAKPVLEYGVTTGFGEFKNIAVEPRELEQLQRNLLLSHSVGAGDSSDDLHPSNYFDPEVGRAALVIRLNAFLRGHSGVRPELAEAVRAMINRGIIPLVPIRGSVGSSGDLCPLSHLFVTLLGENRYFIVRTPEDLAFRHRDLRLGLEHLEEDLGMEVPQPSYKEGLALNNGATFSAALLALAVHDGERAAHVADTACALSLEAVCGCARAFDPKVHEARGHAGQIASAANIRQLLKGSRLIERAGAVQDVYSLRCAPAVHGAARDAIAYAGAVAVREINAATDNPLFFPADGDPWDYEFRDNWPDGYRGDQRAGYSAGNFHGEPVGVAADCLAIGLAELANISERRTQMLLDCHHNRNLPANLIPHPGVNSGFMIAQYCAAGIVSENKVLAHPSSVDSIPTSANSEDHNAMATFAARKLRTVLRNVQAVLAIELLIAAQAVEWRTMAVQADPNGVNTQRKPFRNWEEAEEESRRFVHWTEDRKKIESWLGEGTRRAYQLIREHASPMLTDRTLDGDIRTMRGVVEAGRV
jgi:histidine ammonia-lyase